MNMIRCDGHQVPLPVILDDDGNIRDLALLLSEVLCDTIVEGNWTDFTETEHVAKIDSLPIIPGRFNPSGRQLFVRDSLEFKLGLADRAAASDLRAAVHSRGFSATATATLARTTLRWNPPSGENIAIELGVAALHCDRSSIDVKPPCSVLVYCTFRAKVRAAAPQVGIAHRLRAG